jgi:hypothetical protein
VTPADQAETVREIIRLSGRLPRDHPMRIAVACAPRAWTLAPAPPPSYATLGRSAVACCLAHRRPVRWLAAPCWWYHFPVPRGVAPESRQCRPLLGAKAPIVTIALDGLPPAEADALLAEALAERPRRLTDP